MELPKLRVRPLSTQTVTVWRGLERRDGRGLGFWRDSRNLSSDRYPLLSVRKGRGIAQSIDGNEITEPIVAMVGGDHPVLLDESGNYWCNGHSMYVPYYGNGYFGPPLLGWSIGITRDVQANVEIKPAFGQSEDWEILRGLGVDPEEQTIEQETVRFRCTDHPSGGDPVWESNLGGAWNSDDPAAWGITVLYDNDISGLEISVSLRKIESGKVGGGIRLVRMGARVIDVTNGVWIDAVALAAGDEQVDYGRLAVNSFGGGQVTLTMCDIDGKPYSGVVSSATEPMAQEGYWLDSSGQELTLRQWDVSTRAWVSISSTFVRVDMDDMEQGTDANWTELKKGDTVQLEATLLPEGTDSTVEALLTGTHYLYDFTAGPGPQVSMLLSGVIPAETVTLSQASIRIKRDYPKLDYVVEAQNRLWGCRYSEEEGINEIYASKLGDPANWEVYQGLSTDSWRASRGTAAPFTGAATLDGHPLFFREDSLEKVYPSSSGAHQIQTFDLEGVQEGSADSLCVIEDRLYYKSRQGVCVYAGTMPQRISEALGDWSFSEASAARHGRKYCVSMTRSDGARLCAVYDIATGDWQVEDEAWTGLAITWEDRLYYLDGGRIRVMDGLGSPEGVRWWAETGPITYELPEHKWISYVRIRLESDKTRRPVLIVKLSYDEKAWETMSVDRATILGTRELNIKPRRCDHFRVRLEGTGGILIHSVSYRMERSEGGH